MCVPNNGGNVHCVRRKFDCNFHWLWSPKLEDVLTLSFINLRAQHNWRINNIGLSAPSKDVLFFVILSQSVVTSYILCRQKLSLLVWQRLTLGLASFSFEESVSFRKSQWWGHYFQAESRYANLGLALKMDEVTLIWLIVQDKWFKSASMIGPGRGGTSYLADFDETWPVWRGPPKTTSV